MQTMNKPSSCLALLLLTQAVACGGQSMPATTPAAPVAPTSIATFDGTIGRTEVERNGPVATLRSVHATHEQAFDRVVFELAPDAPMPGYRVEYIDTPAHDCGSGEAKEIAGDAWLEVRMYPVNAHTEAGEPTIPFREQATELSVVRELERTCDFEAVTTWVLGLHAPNPYRVQELNDPPRLVIEVLTTTARAPRQP